MQLTLTFGDGTTSSVTFGNTSTLTVSTDDATVGTWTDVVGLELGPDPDAPAVDGPVQATVTETGEVVPVEVPAPEPTSGDPGDETPESGQADGTETAPTSPETSGSPDSSPPEMDTPPVVDSLAEIPGTPEAEAAQAALDAQPPTVAEAVEDVTPPVSEPVDTAPPAQPDTPAPEPVVAAANDAVDVAVAGTHPDPAGHIAQAITDVDAALAQWPDDEHLQDAKAQLHDLAADLESELSPGTPEVVDEPETPPTA